MISCLFPEADTHFSVPLIHIVVPLIPITLLTSFPFLGFLPLLNSVSLMLISLLYLFPWFCSPHSHCFVSFINLVIDLFSSFPLFFSLYLIAMCPSCPLLYFPQFDHCFVFFMPIVLCPPCPLLCFHHAHWSVSFNMSINLLQSSISPFRCFPYNLPNSVLSSRQESVPFMVDTHTVGDVVACPVWRRWTRRIYIAASLTSLHREEHTKCLLIM